MGNSDLILRKAIVHILDTTKSEPGLSSDCIQTDSEELNSFIKKHLSNLVESDHMDKCIFDDSIESEMRELLKTFEEKDMVGSTQRMAKLLFDRMMEFENVPAADLVVVTFQMHSKNYLAMLKMNYKANYTHTTHNNKNRLVLNKTSLPSGKVDEAILVNLEDKEVSISEKIYEINGEKQKYLSTYYLCCNTQPSTVRVLKEMEKAVKAVNKEFFEEDAVKQLEIKNMLDKEFQDEGEIDTTDIADKLYEGMPAALEAYAEKMDESNLIHEKLKPKNENTVKHYRFQKIKTASGIEIRIPMEVFEDSGMFEIKEEYGKYQIMIKDIETMTVG